MNQGERELLVRDRKVNFAGDYVVIACTCGVLCHHLLIWNARTGQSVDLPFDRIEWPCPGRKLPPAGYLGETERYRANSRLLKLHGCLDWSFSDGPPNCGKHFYEFREGQMIFLRTTPMEPPPPNPK